MLQLALPLLFFTAVSGAFFYCRKSIFVLALPGRRCSMKTAHICSNIDYTTFLKGALRVIGVRDRAESRRCYFEMM